jgi:hypothetical protein
MNNAMLLDIIFSVKVGFELARQFIPCLFCGFTSSLVSVSRTANRPDPTNSSLQVIVFCQPPFLLSNARVRLYDATRAHVITGFDG